MPGYEGGGYEGGYWCRGMRGGGGYEGGYWCRGTRGGIDAVVRGGNCGAGVILRY